MAAGNSYAAAATAAAATLNSANAQIDSLNSTIASATSTASSAASRAASDYATIALAAKTVFSNSSNANTGNNYYSEGLADAQGDYKKDPDYNEEPTYQGGFDGYKDAFNGKAAKKDFTGKSDQYKADYNKSYQVGRTAYLKAVAEGRKAAKSVKNPASTLAGNSAGYVYGYIKEFNAKLKKHPEYIYNTKTVYVHNKATFGTDTRVKKYINKPRNQVHEFKIERIALSKSGLVRYYVKNHLTAGLNKNKGYLTANRNYIVSCLLQ
ncbi:hypothetical protein ACYATO_00015 [Lactobacillaceae bacterium Melli_B3]